MEQGRSQAARFQPGVLGLGSVKLHSVVLSDRGVCPGAGGVLISARERPSSDKSALRSSFPSPFQRLFSASSEPCLSIAF